MLSSSIVGKTLRPACLPRQSAALTAHKSASLRLRHNVVTTAATGKSSSDMSREENRAKQTGVSRGGDTTSSTGTPGGVQSSSYAASPESRAVDRSRAASSSAKKTTNTAASSAQSQVDSAAASTKQGIRQTRSSTARGANQLADQADQTADQLADSAARTTDRLADQADRTADQLAVSANRTARAADRGADEAADQIEEGSEQLAEGVSQAGDQVAEAVRQARDALRDAPPPEEIVDQARDAVDDAIESARSTVSAALSPGPGAPMRAIPLTSMPADPFKASGTDISASGRSKYFKYRLLASVAGLDRGLSATPEAASQVEDAVSYLLSSADPVNLSWTVDEKQGRRSSLAQLNGLWRLVYSSNFAGGGGLGGGSSPFALGQVFQSISTYASRLDNIVELYAKVNLPQLPFLPPVEPVVTTATLKHSFEPVGYGTVQLTFEDTEIKTTGGLNNILGNLPELTLPQLPEPLRPSREQRTSRFDNLYLDDEVRISRGGRGELRIFVRT